MSRTVDIRDDLKATLEKFRFAKRSQGSAALIVKIDREALVMTEEKRFDDITIEELAEELPDNSPRYVVLSYKLKQSDGRISFPLVLINWIPTSCEIGIMTLHASALINFQETTRIYNVIEMQDGPEGLTKDVIDSQLLSK